MTRINLKSALGIGAVIWLAGGGVTVAPAQTTDDSKLTPQEISRKVQDKYDSLTSYSDEGKVVSSLGTTTVPPHKFTIKLARPDLYLVEWEQDIGTYAQKGAVWSAGDGDFTDVAGSTKKVSDRAMAMGTAAGVSGGASATVPGAFLKTTLGQGIRLAMQSAKRKNDEKVGDTDCYVLTQETGGRTQTFWIGKQDFLIRQVENDTSAAALKATMEAAAKQNPQIPLSSIPAGDVKLVETHSNIVVNQPLTKADFDHKVSAGSKP